MNAANGQSYRERDSVERAYTLHTLATTRSYTKMKIFVLNANLYRHRCFFFIIVGRAAFPRVLRQFVVSGASVCVCVLAPLMKHLSDATCADKWRNKKKTNETLQRSERKCIRIN